MDTTESPPNDGFPSAPSTASSAFQENTPKPHRFDLSEQEAFRTYPPTNIELEEDGEADAHDEWKDYSCATPWEYFVNDIDNAIGELEAKSAAHFSNTRRSALLPPPGPTRQGGRRNIGAIGGQSEARLGKKEVVYNGHTYMLRMMFARNRELRRGEEDIDPARKYFGRTDAAPCVVQPAEFPELPAVLGEEECSLDALFSSHLGTGRAEGDATEEHLEREEGAEAWRLLRSWFGVGSFLCVHESSETSVSSSPSDGTTLSLEQLLSTGVVAMGGRRCGAVLALQVMGNRAGSGWYPWRGVSIKGYATLPPRASSAEAFGDDYGGEKCGSAKFGLGNFVDAGEFVTGTSSAVSWTEIAETVRMESETSREVPSNRQSLEALGELLMAKVSAAWGTERSGQGCLEAAARYAWERHLYDGKIRGESGEGQTEWRNRVWRERSHRRRGARDRAIRALLAEAEGEREYPVWGFKEDPLEAIRITAVWEGLGSDRPLPHANLELLGDPLEGNSFDWNAMVTWNKGRNGRGQERGQEGREEGASLGYRLRLLLAAYVHCLALGGDLLMADIHSAAAEVDSSSRERARHIGAVLGPDTRDLVERMRTIQSQGRGGGDGEESDDPSTFQPTAQDVVGTARKLLTSHRLPLTYNRGSGLAQNSDAHRDGAKKEGGTGNDLAAEWSPSSGAVTPATSAAAPSTTGSLEANEGRERDEKSDVGSHKGQKQSSKGVDVPPLTSTVPWLWVPRGGAPACRLVSQVALEAARFGAYGDCLGDVASFWKAFVQEVRLLWEEESFAPRMDPEPPADGYSMYDPHLTGQDASLSATFRRYIAAPAINATVTVAESSHEKRGDACMADSSTQIASLTATHSSGERSENSNGERFSGTKRTDDSGERSSKTTTPISVAAGLGGSGGLERDDTLNGNGRGSPQKVAQQHGEDFKESRELRSAAYGSGRGGRKAAVPLPDMRTCLLHQKLQMLNCCVAEQHRRRAASSCSSSSLPKSERFASPPLLERYGTGNVSYCTEKGAIGSEPSDNDDDDIAGSSAGDHPVQDDAPSTLPTKAVNTDRRATPCTDGGHNGDGARESTNRAREAGDAESTETERSEHQKSASLKAQFSSERDAILRRVGVRKFDGGKAKGDSIAAKNKDKTGDGERRRKSRWRPGKARRQASTSVGDDLPPSPKPRGLIEEIPRNHRSRSSPENATADGPSVGDVNTDGTSSRVDGYSRIDKAAADGEEERKSGAAQAEGSRNATEGDQVALTFTGERLLVTGARVVVPELMPPCPLTSDMLEQQQELVRRLSSRAGSDHSDAEVSKTRVSRLRLATLSSDMISFIRANPGAVLADFVRWYSPHSWLAQQKESAPVSSTSSTTGSLSCVTVSETIRGLVYEIVQRAITLEATHDSVSTKDLLLGGTEPEEQSDGCVGKDAVPESDTESGTGSGIMRDSPGIPFFCADTAAGKSSPSMSMACRLEWAGHGKIVWGRAPEVATVDESGAYREALCGLGGLEPGWAIDEEEGFRWMETWEEAVQTSVSRESGEIRRSRRPLFNPAQEAEKALHYLETIGPAPLVGQLLIALACTAGFLLSEAQTDALELPCVVEALFLVNDAVRVASEGLCEASASGGVLLMDNRVAHPISQATLRACDSLCDAVDEAEVLLSRATSLLDKLPGEYSLVNEILTSNGCMSGTDIERPIAELNATSSGNTFGYDRRLGEDRESFLHGLARYISSSLEEDKDPHLATIDDIALELFGEEPAKELLKGDDSNDQIAGSTDDRYNDNGDGVEMATQRQERSRSVCSADRLGKGASNVYPGSRMSDRLVMPEPSLKEYILNWQLPPAAVDNGQEARTGARLYARIDAPMGGRGMRNGSKVFDDERADLRVAISVAEPAC